MTGSEKNCFKDLCFNVFILPPSVFLKHLNFPSKIFIKFYQTNQTFCVGSVTMYLKSSRCIFRAWEKL